MVFSYHYIRYITTLIMASTTDDKVKMTEEVTKTKNTMCDRINFLCTKYNCELVQPYNPNIIGSQMLYVRSACGHVYNVSLNQFVKHKIGTLYCDNCLQKILVTGTCCFKCNTSFMPTVSSFLFCSTKCTQSRIVTKEKSDKIRTSILKNNPQYINEDGTLKSTEEIKEIRKNKKRKSRELSSNSSEAESTDGNSVNSINSTGSYTKKKKLGYDQIKNTYEKEGCQLITTEEEYMELSKMYKLKNILFNIVSLCGHADTSLYYGLTESRTGIFCKQCTLANMKEYMKINSIAENGCPNSLFTQKCAIDIIKELCSDNLIIKKTRDGCKIDVLAKPINCVRDSWLRIKLKSTQGLTDYAGFRIIQKLEDNFIAVLICVTTKTCWVLLPHQLETKMYYIGKNKDGNSEYIVNDLSEKLTELYSKEIYNSTLDAASVPVSPFVQLEHHYIKKREKAINFIQFDQNEFGGVVYNFKIGNLKVQETVSSKQKNKNTLSASVNKNNGKGKRCPYFHGDNDIYWFNINDTCESFYVVPESVLIDAGYVETLTSVGRNYFSLTGNADWLVSYKFSYKTIQEENEKSRLLSIISSINDNKE